MFRQVNPRQVVRPVIKKFCDRKSGTRTGDADADVDVDVSGQQLDQALTSGESDARGLAQEQDLGLVKCLT